MLQKPKECYEPFPNYFGGMDTGCQLATIGRGFSKPDGSGRLGIIGIGESLGREEVRDGLPFRQRASAGSKLEECLKLAGVDRQDLLLWNIVGCQPPNNELRGFDAAIQHCKVHFNRVVLGVKPAPGCGRRVIIAFGAVPFNTLVPNFTGIAEHAGFVFDNKIQQGPREKPDDEAVPWESRTKQPDYGLIIPTYHPSYLKRGAAELTPLVAEHIQRAVEVANGTYTSYLGHSNCPRFNINEFPSLDDAWSFYNLCRSNSRLCLVFDIETTGSGGIAEDAEEREWGDQQITQIQFGVNDRESIVFPWNEDYMKVVKALLELPNTKANHFLYNFDLPRVKAAGCKVNGQLHDTLWMFKHYQPRLPRGLQNVACMAGFPFPWKYSFTSRPQWYGGCDTIAPHYILRWLPPLMRKMGIWQGYLDEIRDEYRILSRASERGIPVNETKRQEVKLQFKSERHTLNRELQKIVPDGIKGVFPRRKQGKGENGGDIFDYGYVREPTELLEKVRKSWEANGAGYTFEQFLELVTLRSKPNKDGKFDEFKLQKRKFKMVRSDTGEEVEVERWCKVMVFKASSQQMIRYLEYKRKEIEDGKG